MTSYREIPDASFQLWGETTTAQAAFPGHCAQLVTGELITCDSSWALGSTCYSHLTTKDAWRTAQAWRLRVSRMLRPSTCNQYPRPPCGSFLGFASCGPPLETSSVIFKCFFFFAKLPCRLDNHFGSCPQIPHRVFQPRAPLKHRLDSVYLLLPFFYFLLRLPLFCGADRLLSRKPCARKTDT